MYRSTSFALLILPLAIVTSRPAAGAMCETLTSANIEFATITKAETVPAGTFVPPTGAGITGLPEFCRIALTMAPSSDSAIRVEVWMPTAGWNGRFEGLGGGGYTGTINYGTLATAVMHGFAAANTDMGTAPATGGNGLAVVGHPQKWLDFGSRSTHLMTVAGKALTRAFYGEDARYSYFAGCSTGGHQALEEAEVFPDDYDGILGGAPGHNRTHLHAAFVFDFKTAHTAPGSVIAATKLSMLNSAVLTACVGSDGGLATDKFLTDPRKCNFDPAVLQCKGADASNCLTASEVYTAKTFYQGLRNPRTGALIYPGWERGSETGWGGLQGSTQPDFPGILNWALGLNYDPLAVNFDTDMNTVDSTLAPTVNFLYTDLSRFYGHHGKLLLYHGFADPIVVTTDTIRYYDRIRSEQHLSLKQEQSFARLFLVPGMGHCSGGPGPNTFDALTPLMNWVENGDAPESIDATLVQNGSVVMSRPLCAYPKFARYKGTGDSSNASNFACIDNGTNDPPLEMAGREYLSPLIIRASAPEISDAGRFKDTVTIVLSVARGSDTFNEWRPSNVLADGAPAVSGQQSTDGKTYIARFNRRDLRHFNTDAHDRADKKVDLMITGSLLHEGDTSLFAVSATVCRDGCGEEEGERERDD